MLQNAYFLAKIGADTAENEQHFAEILPKIGNYPTGPTGSDGTTQALALHSWGAPWHGCDGRGTDQSVKIGRCMKNIPSFPTSKFLKSRQIRVT